jgi:hypothetical protein
MKTGMIISVEHGPKRDVLVRISSSELFSEISDPPGAIRTADVTGYDVVEELSGGAIFYHLHVRTAAGQRVLFYTAVTQLDVALLLDEFGATLGSLPRSWTKADPVDTDNSGASPLRV